MTEQEVLNKLSELEEYFFYLKNNRAQLKDDISINAIHQDIKKSLERWHRYTGLTIEFDEMEEATGHPIPEEARNQMEWRF